MFTAELSAIWSALEIVKEHPPQKFVIFSDSRSAVEAIQNYYPKNPLVQEIKFSFHKLNEEGKDIEICWIPAHVGVKGNEEADKAAKEAINKNRSRLNVPVSDFFPTLKKFTFEKWQRLWNEEHEDNKLKQIIPNISPWQTSDQRKRHREVLYVSVLDTHF